jgi:hypothetical protein
MRWRAGCGSARARRRRRRILITGPRKTCLSWAMWRNMALSHYCTKYSSPPFVSMTHVSESLESVFCSEGAEWSKLRDNHEISQLHTKFWARRLSHPTLSPPRLSDRCETRWGAAVRPGQNLRSVGSAQGSALRSESLLNVVLPRHQSMACQMNQPWIYLSRQTRFLIVIHRILPCKLRKFSSSQPTASDAWESR